MALLININKIIIIIQNNNAMNLKHLKTVFILCLLFVITNSYSQISPKWELINPKYETAEAFVAGFNVMDYGADPTGTTDQTRLFQSLLDSLGSRTINKGTRWDDVPNGGTLFVPEGKYLFTGYLIIPKGVCIRGEWEKPIKGQPIKGTILMFDNAVAKGNNADVNSGGLTAYEGRSFIILQPSASVRDLNFWYPSQDPNNIVPYPPTILLGQSGYWGNDYTLVSNVTLINSYDGIILSRRAGGGAPNCRGIYGSPLKRGIEIDNIAEVGRVDEVDFSSDYWAGSGLPGAPSVDGGHKKYIAENATAMTVRRIDWSFTGKIKAEGYNTGYKLGLSFNPDTNGNLTSPNGHNYAMEFTNCKYGVYVSAASGAGMMFYDYTFTNCDYGFYFDTAPEGIVQILGCRFDTNVAALYAPQTNNTKILINQSTINRGPIDIRGGLASIVNCDFNNEPNQIVLGPNARAIVTGNRFKKEPSIKNVSFYECIIDHDQIEMATLPSFPYKFLYDFKQKPAGKSFYLATDHGISVEANDNSDALQALLDKAKNEGGGVVFLPPGHYNFRKPIRIPTGVELKGSVDTPSLPTGPGSAMEIYAGKGEDEAGTPFITMDPGSGIRGLVMNYPEQMVQLLTDPELNNLDVYHYPYTIRGNKDVYIVNIAMRACFHGIDLFTNKCDNHFIDYLAGHVFRTGIRVGGGSKGGHIYNVQFNQIAYGSGGETKFGRWPNSPDNNNPDNAQYRREHSLSYAYCWNHLDFMIFEDCEDQILFNNFGFGSNKGIVLSSKNGKGPQGLSLGQGIDAGMKAFYIDGVGEKGFQFINSQIVTTDPGDDVQQTYRSSNRYIQVTPDHKGKVTFFGADFWGSPQNISVEVLSGDIELQAGNFSNSGRTSFASIKPDAMFDIIGTNVNSINSLLISGSEPQFYIQSSFVNTRNVALASCGLWFNNLEQTAQTSPLGGAFLPRVGWIATASVLNDDAMLSLDGNTDTRWSTSTERQKPGQWFMVDMLTEQTFNGVYMETGGATYNPNNYRILISNDGESWTEVAAGRNSNQANFDTQKARYIKIEQNGTSTNAWRIAEFYAINTYIGPNTGIKFISSEKQISAWFSADGQFKINGLTGISTVKIYAISGQQLIPEFTFDSSATINLPRGIYIAVVKNNGITYRKKIIKP